jgi:site-specific recombinase XerC
MNSVNYDRGPTIACSDLRLSEMTGLKRKDLIFGAGARPRVIGKGRKERCTPTAKSTCCIEIMVAGIATRRRQRALPRQRQRSGVSIEAK